MASSKLLPKVAVRGIAGGMLLMALFTSMWAGIASSALPFAWSALALIVFNLLSLMFVVHSILLFIKSREFPTLSGSEDKAFGKRMGITYGLVFGAEGLFISLAVGILNALHKDAYVIPTIALIVGLHFYPMAKVFRRTIDCYLASWVCVIAAAGIWMVLHDASQQTVSALVGVGTACATTTYGIYMWRLKHDLIAKLHRSQN